MFSARNTLLTRPSGSAPPSGVMIDAISAGSYTKGAAGTPKSTTDTITVNGANPNRLLLGLFTTSSGGSANPSDGNVQLTDTPGGTLTKVTGSQQPVPSNLGSVQWRYLLAPAGGAHSVVGNYSGGAWINGVALVLVSLYNVNQTTPFGTPVLSSGNGQAVNNTVNATVNDLILWGIVSDINVDGPNRTARITNLGSSDAGYGDYTNLQSAVGVGSPLQLLSSGASVHGCSGLPVLAA